MSPTPAVSVVIPLYNNRETFSACIESLLAQTMQDFEIVIVDDGSNDGSAELAEAFASRDSRISVLHQDNQFAGVARNKGIDASRGKYLLFLDSDDFFEPNLLESSFTTAEEAQADICQFGAYFFNSQTGAKKKRKGVCNADLCPAQVFTPEENPINILAFTTPAPWSKLYRAEFIRKEGLRFQALPNSNDLAFTCLANILARSIALLDAPLVNYRTNQKTSLQGSKQKDPHAFYRALLHLRDELARRGLLEQFAVAHADNALRHCMYNLESMKDPQGKRAVFDLLKGEALEELGVLGRPREDFPNCPPKRWQRYTDLLENDFEDWMRIQQEREAIRREQRLRAQAKTAKASTEQAKPSEAPDGRSGENSAKAPSLLRRIARKAKRITRS